MCGTGDISVSDFKAHAVVIGGSWHFREKVSEPKFFQLNLYHIIQKKFQREKAEKQTSQLAKAIHGGERQMVIQTDGNSRP